MKRRIENEEAESTVMEVCMKMFSELAGDINVQKSPTQEAFECKTCNRKFSSFQALGGHRASHKRPKLEDSSVGKPKIHECSICGLGFSLGQALGGHMRKHTESINGNESFSFSSINQVVVASSSSSARTMCLDLNLTPLENDLKTFNVSKKNQYLPTSVVGLARYPRPVQWVARHQQVAPTRFGFINQ
ncbi:hypothetical protein JHK86_007755 [Glycine max]|nr:hypothetical protein JHK86_007755 [Glycine max]